MCKSKNCDRFLLESSLYNYPAKGMQNLLKLEIGVRDAEFRRDVINYELHVTIRLVKITYVDQKSVAAIGEQPFYRLPFFEKVILA